MTVQRCRSIDAEWHSLTGALTCVQVCDLRADGSTSAPRVLPAWPSDCDEAATMLRADLLDPACVMLGHNIAGDLLALSTEWGLLRELEAAYAAGRVRCTYLAQLLLNIAWPGRPTWVWLPAEPTTDEDDETDPDAPGHRWDARRRGFWALRKYAPHATLGEIEITDDDADGGRGVRVKSGLGDLLLRYNGLDISADKKGADSWRLRYGELIGVPIAEWPPEALRYALEDPVHAAQLRVAQMRRPSHPYAGAWCEVFYPAKGSAPWAPVRCEQIEAWAHLALVDMAQAGMMIDSHRVTTSRERLHKVAEVAEATAVRTGVVRLEVSHDAAAAANAGLTVLAVTHDRAAAKGVSLSPQQTRDLFAEAKTLAGSKDPVARAALDALAVAHPWLKTEVKRDASAIREVFTTAKALAAARDADALAALTAEHPWVKVDRVKCDDEVRERATAAYKAAGWRELPKTASGAISAGADNLVRVVGPADRDRWIAERAANGVDPTEAADAFDVAAADLRLIMGPDLLAQLQAWTDAGELDRLERALGAAADPGLASHLARQKAQTFDGSFLAPIDAATREAKRAAEVERYEAANGRPLTPEEAEHLARKWAPDGPARYGVSPCKSTTRAGLRGDVRQNMPKGGGVRECYVPRPGHVLVAVDYAACELSCQADNLDDLVVRQVLREDRYSTLGQAIRAGDDCHLRVVATLRSEPYDQIAPFYKAIKKLGADAPAGELKEWKVMDRQRAGGKEANFGFWGGMGPKKFAFLQARKGNPITEGFARDLRTGWIGTWDPEATIYFRLANEATTTGGMLTGATVVHAKGGHVRGAVDYCQWSNTHFQYLAARGAKFAAIMLRRACLFDASSPLFGVARPLIFIHDEFVVEVKVEAVDAFPHDDPRSPVAEIGRVMRAGMRKVVDTPVKTEATVHRDHWAK